MNQKVTGSELIARFIEERCFQTAFLVTGGACAFIVDAIARNPTTNYVCVQHEQAAAMAVDAIWRTSGQIGVTVATSGPGATNLITGIACSWFDSIPALHITGQVNQRESSDELGVNVRQAGFQETDIVEMVRPITKFAVRVKSTKELAAALHSGLTIANEGRKGPVLIDVPMDVQQALCSDEDLQLALQTGSTQDIVASAEIELEQISTLMSDFITESERPLFVLGAGLLFGRQISQVQNWCDEHGIPYCASWGALPHIDRGARLYQGSIGVYGSRIGNWAVQSADRIVVLGSRLDNRQRTGNADGFAPYAKILVLDIDPEELGKYRKNKNYVTQVLDLQFVDKVLPVDLIPKTWEPWRDTLKYASTTMDSGFGVAVGAGKLSPYEVVPKVQSLIDDDAIVIADCGANLCWVYQSFAPSNQLLFTAGGNSPMAYSLPAAIGAKIAEPGRQVICFIGDGGFQMNIQELQTVIHYDLDIKIIILNNSGYGIIKQFQDSYFESRYEATGNGYSLPDFGAVSQAYGLKYRRIEKLSELDEALAIEGACVIDVILPENTLITPKVEMDRFIHDQFPYGSLDKRAQTPYRYPVGPSGL